jgi:ABC-type transporter Mla subunit MlaD
MWESMTSEERWIKIENALQAVAENHAAHDSRMAQIEEQIQKNASQIEKNADGIRDLIRLAASNVQWQQAADERLNRALDRLDQRFDHLTKLLERWFRHGGANGHEG